MPPDEARLRWWAEAMAIVMREQARRALVRILDVRVLEQIREDLEVALANVKAHLAQKEDPR